MGTSTLVTLIPIVLTVLVGGALLGIVSAVQVARLRRELVELRSDVATLREERDTTPASWSAAVEASALAPLTDETETPNADRQSASDELSPTPTAPDVIAAPPPPPPPSSATPPPPPPAPPGRSRMRFEDRLGSQLTVWIGGIALALGGIFLVRYTIDAGLLGPAARVILGALLSGALLGLGEVTRREDVVGKLAERLPSTAGQLPHAYIPGILTAAGLMTAFATAFAAYALYGFLGDVVAFALLALISFAGLALSVRHGPWIATLGLLGAYVTPALVASDAPSAWSLFLYLLIVTGAVYLTAWFRGWARLAYLGCAGAVGWGVLWLATTFSAGDGVALAVFCVGLPVLALIFLRDETAERMGVATGDEIAAAEENDPLAEVRTAMRGQGPLIPICIANAVLTLLFVQNADHNALATLATAAVCSLFLASASHWRTLLPLAAVAGSTFLAHLLTWPGMIGLFDVHLPDQIARAVSQSTALPSWFSALGSGRLARFAILGSMAFAGLGLLHTFTRRPHAIWAGIATAVPLAAFIIAYLRLGNLSESTAFALAGLLIAALYAAIVDRLDRQIGPNPAPFEGWSVGAFAAAACGFLALAFTVSLSRGWLTIAFALMAPAMVWIASKRPIPILRWVAAGLAALVVARLIYDPRIVGSDLGTTPILNWILIGYGIPTLAFAAAAVIMLRTRDDLPAQIVRAAATAFGVTFISIEIRHLMNNGNVFATPVGLAEVAVQSLAWLGMSLGLRWGSFARRDGLMLQAANIIGLVAVASLAGAHLFVFNPYVTNAPLAGSVIVNTLLLAYAAPAALCGLIVWQFTRRADALPAAVVPGLPWTPRTFADAFAMVRGALALLLAFAYLTMQVSRVFQGPVITLDPSQGELYAWSAVWIAFAVSLLAAGLRAQSHLLRHAGFAVLLIATFKIFLVDMSALSGLLRALSFIGLGGALVGIGYAYQRLVLRNGAPDAEATSEDAV